MPVSGLPPLPPATISIVATNDVHGQLERIAYMAGFVDNVRKARGTSGGVLLVDGGDAFQGTIESGSNEGKAVVSAYAQMGYAALSLGNHEFDFGPSGPASMACDPSMDPQGAIKARVAEAPFPILSANLQTADGKTPPWKNLARSTITTVAGVRVGIIGLITAEAADVIKSPNFVGLKVAPLAEAAIAEATALRQRGVDLVVVVAHAGGECTHFESPDDVSSCDPSQEIFRFARALPKGLVDVIVGGHRNAGVAHSVEGIPVVHTPSHLVAFSRVDISWDPTWRKVVSKKVYPPHPVCQSAPEEPCAPGSYEGAKVEPDPKVLELVRPSIEAARALRDRPLGVQVDGTFHVKKLKESALGNLFADLMREAVPGADAAFGNAGSVRDDVPAGVLTFGHLHHAMPFDNQLAKLRLTGAQFRRLITVNITQRGHGPLALSGIGVIGECQSGQPRVTLTRPNGAAIRDDEHLLVVTNDFIALGGDGLLPAIGLPDSNIEYDGGKTVLDVIIAGLEKRHTISPADKALFDPEKPRMRLQGGFPLLCGGPSSNAPGSVVPPRAP
jgi:2',3'-cyclic-nucleotide 2'-phosphodiesterase (5'-nucleotidase family)